MLRVIVLIVMAPKSQTDEASMISFNITTHSIILPSINRKNSRALYNIIAMLSVAI
jgi:hypothetical protein